MKVMKIINLIIGIACLLGACHSNRMRIEGEIGDIKENKIYLGEITNTYYGLFDPIDSAEIEEGKFTFTVDRAKKQMLFLGFRPGQGGMVFAEAGNLRGDSTDSTSCITVELSVHQSDIRSLLSFRSKIILVFPFRTDIFFSREIFPSE